MGTSSCAGGTRHPSRADSASPRPGRAAQEARAQATELRGQARSSQGRSQLSRGGGERGRLLSASTSGRLLGRGSRAGGRGPAGPSRGARARGKGRVHPGEQVTRQRGPSLSSAGREPFEAPARGAGGQAPRALRPVRVCGATRGQLRGRGLGGDNRRPRRRASERQRPVSQSALSRHCEAGL